MKTYLVSLILILGALTAHPVSTASFQHTATSAKECTDCGCGGPETDGSCGMEKGKKCHCKK